MFSTPILLLVFNKTDTTQRVLDQIRAVKPTQLFVVGDGPRANNITDVEKCARVRELVLQGVDWECDLRTLFREENLGCGRGPASAITWFFNQVDRGIILEDDCLPALDFFEYCTLLLQKYEKDTRVMHISGHNPLESYASNNQVLFSKYSFIWGWASWARAWATYDYTMSGWSTPKARQKVKAACSSRKEWKYWKLNFDKYASPTPNSVWDYQWQYALFMHRGISVVPTTTLIKNIGLGHPDATHTTQPVDTKMPFSHDLSTSSLNLGELTGPLEINNAFDAKVFQQVFSQWLPAFNLKALVYNNVYQYFPEFIKRIVARRKRRS